MPPPMVRAIQVDKRALDDSLSQYAPYGVIYLLCDIT